MKKRRFFTMLVIFACIASVVGGQIYYNNKLEKTAYAAKLELADKSIGTEEKTNESVKEVVHFKNAPQDISERYNQKKDTGEVFAFHLIGSTNTSQDEGTWAQFFTSEMKNIYKEDISIQTSSFSKSTSTELIENKIYDDITAVKADVVLIEPPLLNDNEGISMKDTLYVLDNLITDIRMANPESIILLQPSNPIFSPEKYGAQVEGLEKYAKEQNFSYLNHWSSWPSIDSEEIKDYYNNETLLSNEKGHKLWADYMINLFK